jgi:hypothetical protein
MKASHPDGVGTHDVFVGQSTMGPSVDKENTLFLQQRYFLTIDVLRTA